MRRILGLIGAGIIICVVIGKLANSPFVETNDAPVEADVLPSLPCELPPGDAVLNAIMSPAKQSKTWHQSGYDSDWIIRQNTALIASVMGSLVHPGTWDGRPDRIAQAELADPVAHAHSLCSRAYWLRELRAEILYEGGRVPVADGHIADSIVTVPATTAFAKTRISKITCPVAQEQYWLNGKQGIALPCWVVDAYEARLVNAGFCYRRFGPNWFWQQCRMSSAPTLRTDGTVDTAWSLGNQPCFGGDGPECYPVSGSPLRWSRENLPCYEHDSNDPRYSLRCAVVASLAAAARARSWVGR